MKIDVNKIWYPFKEYWRDIEGYEGLYQVSNWGRVKALNYHRSGVERLLQVILSSHGYPKVNLYYNRKMRTCLIHRLLSLAFIPNPHNYTVINHRSEIKTENWVELDDNGNVLDSNLEWCNITYNNNYGTRIEKTEKPVLQYDLNMVLVKEFKSGVDAAKQTGFSRTSIRLCCQNKKVDYKGFIWKYKEGEAS